MATAYEFDGQRYEDTEAGRQELLEAVSDAVSAVIYNDPDYANDEEREQAVELSWQNTSREADFWHNMEAVMRDAPCDLRLKRVQVPDDGKESPCKHCDYNLIYQAAWQRWEHYDSGETWCYDDEHEAEPK